MNESEKAKIKALLFDQLKLNQTRECSKKSTVAGAE